MTDPIADLLTRIRNANLASLKELTVPYSKIKYSITQKMITKGFLTSAKMAGEEKLPEIKIVLPGKVAEKQPYSFFGL